MQGNSNQYDRYAEHEKRAGKNLNFSHALGLNRMVENTVGLNTEYRVTFSIDVQLQAGEILAIAGDLPILG